MSATTEQRLERLEVAMFGKPEHRPKLMATVDAIIQRTAAEFGVTAADLKGRGRPQRLVTPRHVAMHLLQLKFDAGSQELAGWLGRKDHNTSLHGVRKVRSLMTVEGHLRNRVLALEREFGLDGRMKEESAT